VIRRLADELGLEVTEAQLKAAADSVMKSADVPRDVDPNQRFIDLLRPEVAHNPEDVRQVSMLAQVYFQAGDFANARKWFARMIEIGGSDEGTFWAMLRVAQSMEMLGEPWPDVHEAYLRAWEFRPTRAEPLYDIARHYIAEKRARLGYLYAQRAAEIPLPEDDMTIPNPDLYAWRTTFQQLVCAYHIDEQAEALTLSRRLLARPDIPDGDRQGIASIRDLTVPTMLEAASSYPDVLARNLIAGPREAEVTVSLVAGADRAVTEQTLNSFLHCCTDVSRVGRFLVVDAGLSAHDRATLQEGYTFLEFADCAPGTQLRDHIHGRYWLHLGQGWRFFAPENLIARLTAVLDVETQVFQVGINLDDAVTLTGTSAPEQTVRRTPDASRYVLADVQAKGPAMFDTTRLDQPGGTATLDEVLCIAAV
jgi:tetratricopeptide (TPR) repeat protein